MSDELADMPEAEQRLEELRQQAGDLIEPAMYRSSFELYGQLRQRAKREQLIYFYVTSVFHQMDQAQYLLEFETMRERAIELISLLESEEQCRKIQPDMPVQLYEAMVYQMSSCAYENLAEATGQMEGYNSEGLQACIADGLHICRQTGKLACVGCFREYSCDVYMSADDAELASHQCSLVLDENAQQSDRGDRRWLAKKKLAWLAFLEGRTDEAIRLCRQSLELSGAEDVSLKLESRLRVMYDLDAMLIVTGKPTELPHDPIAAQHPPEGECPAFDLMRALNHALEATVAGDYEAAKATLTDWDRKLQEQRAIHLWFEVRLRLLANCMLAGELKQAEKLANQLQKRASQAGDWLTLRRLTALQDTDFATSPLAVYGQSYNAAGPTPAVGSPAPSDAEATDEAKSFSIDADPSETPLAAAVVDFGKRISQVSEAHVLEELEVIRKELLALGPAEVEHPLDACALVHFAGFALADHADAEAVWRWANQLVAKFDSESAALSLLADLGNQIRFGPNHEFAETITSERIEPLVRKSLQMENVTPRSYMRAGDHFLADQNHGEAERCYARGFRLDRTIGELALRLANLYRDTDRPRDGLHVLDLCLREGTENPAVAWEAALLAFGLERYEVMVTYLNQFENQAGPQQWTDYYRAIGLIELSKSQEAKEAISREKELLGSDAFHLDVVLASAMVGLNELEGSLRLLQRVYATPLYEVEHLTTSGIVGLLRRARWAAERIAAADGNTTADEILSQGAQLAQDFTTRLLEAGCAPDEIFEEANEVVESTSVNYYRCVILQPLENHWDEFPSRFAEQEGWDSYLAEWGVLAEDEEQAKKFVLSWQSRCFGVPAEVEDLTLGGEGYMDRPGVVWQGPRICPRDIPDDGFDGDFLDDDLDANDLDNDDFDDDFDGSFED